MNETAIGKHFAQQHKRTSAMIWDNLRRISYPNIITVLIISSLYTASEFSTTAVIAMNNKYHYD